MTAGTDIEGGASVSRLGRGHVLNCCRTREAKSAVPDCRAAEIAPPLVVLAGGA
jgi:hypothetical protein